MKDGIENAATLTRTGVNAVCDPDFEIREMYWTTYNNNEKYALWFVMGRNVYGYNEVRARNSYWRFSLREPTTPLTAEKVASLQAEAKSFVHEQIRRNRCPHCLVQMHKNVLGASAHAAASKVKCLARGESTDPQSSVHMQKTAGGKPAVFFCSKLRGHNKAKRRKNVLS